MSHCHQMIVVRPAIPEALLTPLERLLLFAIFETTVDAEGIHFLAPAGVRAMFALPAATVRIALAEEHDRDGPTAEFVRATLARSGGALDSIAFDITTAGWEWLFQPIVARSPEFETVEAIEIHYWSGHLLGRSPLGGLAIVITGDLIVARSLADDLEDLRADVMSFDTEALVGPCIRPSRSEVRAIVGELTIVDDRLGAIDSSDVTDRDIDAALGEVDIDPEDDEAHAFALYRAAVTAIGAARSRLAAR